MAYIGRCPEESPQVKAALAELGLTWPHLWQAIRDGEEQRQTATSHEPNPAGGLKDWIARVGTLRRTLAARDWQPINDYQIPLSISPDGATGVGVLLGDEKTGEGPASRSGPRSRYPKGPKILEVAARNEQLSFDDEGIDESKTADDQADGEADEQPEIWFLVTHRILLSHPPAPEFPVHVHSELSLPGKSAGQDTPTYIDKWLKRIPLPPSSFRLNPETPPYDDDNLDEIPDDL